MPINLLPDSMTRAGPGDASEKLIAFPEISLLRVFAKGRLLVLYAGYVPSEQLLASCLGECNAVSTFKALTRRGTCVRCGGEVRCSVGRQILCFPTDHALLNLLYEDLSLFVRNKKQQIAITQGLSTRNGGQSTLFSKAFLRPVSRKKRLLSTQKNKPTLNNGRIFQPSCPAVKLSVGPRDNPTNGWFSVSVLFAIG